MAEVIGPGGPRIKFAAHRTGELLLPAAALPPLGRLAALMHRLEERGVIPVLDDGLVGGNRAIVASAASNGSGDDGNGSSMVASSSGASGAGDRGSSSGAAAALQGVLISRSGKPPNHALQAGDWVLLQRFDPASWSAEYLSASEAARPSSDAPLHAAALGPGAAERYGWAEAPAVAVHGHALAEGPGGCCLRAGSGMGAEASRLLRQSPASEPVSHLSAQAPRPVPLSNRPSRPGACTSSGPAH